LLIVKERKTGIKGSSAPGFVKTGSQNCRLAGYLRQNGLKRLFAEKCSINQITFARDSHITKLAVLPSAQFCPRWGAKKTMADFFNKIGHLFLAVKFNKI
jgi:hypothetical protein